MGSPAGSLERNLSASAGNKRDVGSVPGQGNPLEEEMTPTLGFLPGESDGQRSLMGYSA